MRGRVAAKAGFYGWLFVVVCFVGRIACAQIPADALLDTLDYYRTVFNVMGASASIRFPDGEAWNGASGWSDTVGGTPVDTDMVFAIGSITKTFTAVLVMKLLERGAINSLDDAIGTYISLANSNIGESITLRQLLEHTSGLYDYVTDPDFAAAVWFDLSYWWPPDSPLAYVRAPYFSPGDSFRYSNTNYLILGLIVRQLLAVDTLGGFLRDSLLEPLGLRRTFFFPEMAIPASVRVAHPHFDIDGNPQTQEDASGYPRIAIHSTAWTAGCLYATPENVARFVHDLFNYRVISSTSVGLMTQFNTYNYGMGVARGWYRGYEVWAHEGAILGYTAVYIHVPLLNITVCLATNNSSVRISEYAFRLLDVAIDYVTFSGAATDMDAGKNLSVAVYRGEVHIKSSESFLGWYRLFSIDGRVALAGSLYCGHCVVDVSMLPVGTYILSLPRWQFKTSLAIY